MDARRLRKRSAAITLLCWLLAAHAQVPPSPVERSDYTGLFAAAAQGEAARVRRLKCGTTR